MIRNLRSQHDFRSSILRNQLTSLIIFEGVTTTVTKANELVAYSNHFFNRVRTNDLAAKKYAHATLLDQNAISKLFEEIVPSLGEKTNFTRSLKVAARKGDNAPMALVMLNIKATSPVVASKPAKVTGKAKVTVRKK